MLTERVMAGVAEAVVATAAALVVVAVLVVQFSHYICQPGNTQFDSAWQGFALPPQLGYLLERVTQTNDVLVQVGVLSKYHCYEEAPLIQLKYVSIISSQ